jgi:hypothetical protein
MWIARGGFAAAKRGKPGKGASKLEEERVSFGQPSPGVYAFYIRPVA